MIKDEIESLKNNFVDRLMPEKIFLFGSYANGTFKEESDLDFYIVVADNVPDIAAETVKAYKAIRDIKNRPVDIILGTSSRFEQRKEMPSIESEVSQKGVLIYEAASQRMV